MFEWLRRLFGRQARVENDAARTGRPFAAGSPPAPPDVDFLPVSPERAAAEPGAAQVVDQLVTQVLQHFDACRPGAESFPGLAARIVEVVQAREPDFNKLVRIVGQDAAVAGRLLHLANCAIYRAEGEVTSVRAAAMRLGFRAVGEVALGLAGRSLFENDARSRRSLYPERWDALFHASMTSAFSAGALAARIRGGQPDCAFLAGMLHHVGKPVALRAIAALQLDGQLDPRLESSLLDEVIERAHVHIGATMADIWTLPDYLRVVMRHHADDEIGDRFGLQNLYVVMVTDGLARARAGTLTAASRTRTLHAARRLGLGEPGLKVAITEHAEMAARVETLFGVKDPHAAPARQESAPAAGLVMSGSPA